MAASIPRRAPWLPMILLLAVASLAAPATSGASAGRLAPYDPYILAVIAAEGRADFYVVLQVQADLSAAARLDTKAEKGRYVYDALTDVAARTQGPILDALAAEGVPYEPYWIRNMVHVRGDEALLFQMAARPDVAEIVYDYPPVLDQGKPQFSSGGASGVEWNVARVHADDVWALGFEGQGAVVGHLDTGVDWEHPALIRSYRPHVPGAPTRHDYNWYDGPNGSPVPLDYQSHGTATMGTIVGDDGGSNQIGVAPGAYWIACAGLGPNATLPDCFQFFLAPTLLDGSRPWPDLAPHVINNSWSSDADYHDIIQALYAAGIYFAKAAGNEGPGCGTVTNPGQWPEVTAVGAFDAGDQIASWSSRGPYDIEGRLVIKPDLAAPGVNIRSSLPGGLFGSKDGTSMACPHVVGAVALLISTEPQLAGEVVLLQQLLERTAEGRRDLQCPPNAPGGVPNNVWGHGILDAYAAVDAAVNLGRIEGMVSDLGSGDPIPDATVTAASIPGTDLFTYTTDALGAYGGLLWPGTYIVSAQAAGYHPSEGFELEILPGTVAVQNFNLVPLGADTIHAQALAGLVLPRPTGQGLVLAFVQAADQGSMPLSNVLVEATWTWPGGSAPRAGYTQTNGWTRFLMLATAPGIYQICVDDLTLEGYLYNPGENVITCRQWDWQSPKPGEHATSSRTLPVPAHLNVFASRSGSLSCGRSSCDIR